MCMILFSANRPNYLEATINSLYKLDFSGIDLKVLLIDDYPEGRSDKQIVELGDKAHADFVILHQQNRGITRTWMEAWDLLRDDNFDYIFMHEDDAVHTQSVKIMDLLPLLDDPEISQIEFGRNLWYPHEQYPDKHKHTRYKNYYLEFDSVYFWMMCSICKGNLLHEPIAEDQQADLSESVVAHYLSNKFNMKSCVVRSENCSPLIDHIGEWCQGRKLSTKGDPGWERLGMYQVGNKYCSRTGEILSGAI